MRPSLRAILWNDWPALASWIGIAVVWVLHFAFPLLKGTAARSFILLPVISTLVLLGVLAWRVLRIHALFSRGTELPGEITSIRLVKDRGRLEFAYQIGESPAFSWLPVHKTKRVLQLQIGQTVRVLVDPANPSRAIVKELFL